MTHESGVTSEPSIRENPREQGSTLECPPISALSRTSRPTTISHNTAKHTRFDRRSRLSRFKRAQENRAAYHQNAAVRRERIGSVAACRFSAQRHARRSAAARPPRTARRHRRPGRAAWPSGHPDHLRPPPGHGSQRRRPAKGRAGMPTPHVRPRSARTPPGGGRRRTGAAPGSAGQSYSRSGSGAGGSGLRQTTTCPSRADSMAALSRSRSKSGR